MPSAAPRPSISSTPTSAPRRSRPSSGASSTASTADAGPRPLIRVWRLTQPHNSTFDGEGARRYGGRWNPRGTRVVYTSATLSLAVMELLVHLDDDDLARAYVAVPAEIPDNVAVKRLRVTDLPRRWRSYPAPGALAELGGRWAAAGESAVLAVPSAVIPHELNYLLNPRHPHFKRVRVGKPEPFAFDPRLRKRK